MSFMAFLAQSAVRLCKKLDPLIHDAHGAWCAKFGPPLEIVSSAPSVRERISIRPPARTLWENPLEAANYGSGEGRAVVEHPEVFLYRLEDISVTGSEALAFTGPHTLLRLDPSLNDFALRKVRRPWCCCHFCGFSYYRELPPQPVMRHLLRSLPPP